TIEVLAAHTIGPRPHDEWAVLQIGEQGRCDIAVELQQIAFGDALFGPEQLVEIAHDNLAPTNVPGHFGSRFGSHRRLILLTRESLAVRLPRGGPVARRAR